MNTSTEALIEVVRGPEGNCLYIGNDDGGHRLQGPKPWGGGQTIHSFVVNLDELIREAEALRREAREVNNG